MIRECDHELSQIPPKTEDSIQQRQHNELQQKIDKLKAGQ